jgi:hypothetical protein
MSFLSFQLLSIGGLVPQASVTAEFPNTQVCLNLYDFYGAYRFISWTPQVSNARDICRVQVGHIVELVLDDAY